MNLLIFLYRFHLIQLSILIKFFIIIQTKILRCLIILCFHDDMNNKFAIQNMCEWTVSFETVKGHYRLNTGAKPSNSNTLG